MVTRNNRYGSIHTVFTLALFLSTIVTHANGQEQVTLSPSKDNTLYESATGSLSNGAGSHFFAGRTNQLTESIRRGLLAFDVAGAVPAGATVTNVTLTLTMTHSALGTGAQPFSLHRVLADWGEGSSVALGNGGQGAPSTTGDATWIHSFFNTTFWAAPGSDFVPVPSASRSVDTTLGPYIWGSTLQMVSDVQGWLANPSENFGWVLIGNENSSQTTKRFASLQNVEPTVHPQLTITYLPSVGVETGEWDVREFALFQNYPNPFNPSTRIVYRVKSREFIELRVFDVLGRQVAALVNEVKEPGEHSVTFEASRMSSGVYFYRLTASSFIETKKLLLLK
ncbi:MAG TPA: DNRLRE domain-containing protein [Bacteroidota bacterium]|nr:DNRLRE domain-containing protein [Bacteroidota bacterium]